MLSSGDKRYFCRVVKVVLLVIVLPIFGIWVLETVSRSEDMINKYFSEKSLIATTKTKWCRSENINLTGPVEVETSPRITDDDVIEHIFGKRELDFSIGGKYVNKVCKSQVNTAIIIPFRNRELQLLHFLYNMIPIFSRQLIDFRIFVIEQVGNTTFNRGLLMNIGFLESTKQDAYSCYVFHDVDLLLENDNAIYDCRLSPCHLSAAVDKWNYRLPYPSIFGGAEAFKKEEYKKINGYSNNFWGWGGEDDDLYIRTIKSGMTVKRYPMEIARYKMNQVDHMKDYKYESLPKDWKRKQKREGGRADGVDTSKYLVTQVKTHKLYTRISVHISPEVD